MSLPAPLPPFFFFVGRGEGPREADAHEGLCWLQGTWRGANAGIRLGEYNRLWRTIPV